MEEKKQKNDFELLCLVEYQISLSIILLNKNPYFPNDMQFLSVSYVGQFIQVDTDLPHPIYLLWLLLYYCYSFYLKYLLHSMFNAQSPAVERSGNFKRQGLPGGSRLLWQALKSMPTPCLGSSLCSFFFPTMNKIVSLHLYLLLLQ